MHNKWGGASGKERGHTYTHSSIIQRRSLIFTALPLSGASSMRQEVAAVALGFTDDVIVTSVCVARASSIPCYYGDHAEWWVELYLVVWKQPEKREPRAEVGKSTRAEGCNAEENKERRHGKQEKGRNE